MRDAFEEMLREDAMEGQHHNSAVQVDLSITDVLKDSASRPNWDEGCRLKPQILTEKSIVPLTSLSLSTEDGCEVLKDQCLVAD